MIRIDERIRSHISPLRPEERANLEEMILHEGCRDRLIIWNDTLLDGHNRYEICQKHNIPFETLKKEFPDIDAAIEYIEKNQISRRNITPDQFAYYLGRELKRATSGRGGDRKSIDAISNRQNDVLISSRIADEHGVSQRTVERSAVYARDIDVAAEALGHGVRTELLSGKDKLTRQDVSEIAAIAPEAAGLSFASAREALDWAKQQKVERAAAKKDARSEREASLAEATIAASLSLGTKLYGVIYADPPWRFEPYSRETGMDRAADNHYPTSSTDQIAAIKVPVAADCILFLWATAPMLPDGLQVMAAWGFTYKSHCIWVKDRIGTGYWFRNKHEILLVGTKGKIPAPFPGEQPASIIEAVVARHSEKPAIFAELIEKMFPNLPSLEMFARNPRQGWDVWGNEANGEEE